MKYDHSNQVYLLSFQEEFNTISVTNNYHFDLISDFLNLILKLD